MMSSKFFAKVQQALTFHLDTKSAKRFFRLCPEIKIWDFEYYNVYSACFVHYFYVLRNLPVLDLKHPEKICLYNKKDMLDAVTRFKVKDVKNKIFSTCRKDLFWFMALDCMVTNTFPSKEMSLVKQLTDGEKLKFLMQGLEEIQKQIQLRDSTIAFSDKNDEDGEDKFESNLSKQSALIQHRNYVYSLQILVQKLYYNIKPEILDFVLYHHDYPYTTPFDILCLESGLPWMCRRFVNMRCPLQNICSEKKFIPKSWPGHAWLKLVGTLQNRNFAYPTFFPDADLSLWKSHFWALEELCFLDSFRDHVMTADKLVHHNWILKNAPKGFEIPVGDTDKFTIVGLCRLFDTGLYKFMDYVPFSWVQAWYTSTKNVILDPAFIEKIDTDTGDEDDGDDADADADVKDKLFNLWIQNKSYFFYLRYLRKSVNSKVVPS